MGKRSCDDISRLDDALRDIKCTGICNFPSHELVAKKSNSVWLPK